MHWINQCQGQARLTKDRDVGEDTQKIVQGRKGVIYLKNKNCKRQGKFIKEYCQLVGCICCLGLLDGSLDGLGLTVSVTLFLYFNL
jgi:hypothetical protein